MTKVFTIKEATRKRCRIVPITPQLQQRFQAISLEHFAYIWDLNHLSFSLYIRVADEMIEYMRPQEFSKELLEQIWMASLREQASIDVFVLRKDYPAFERALQSVREGKIQRLLERDPSLDRRTLDAFANLSGASQMVLRGGITQHVAEKVKSCAAFMVKQLMDNELAMGTLSRMIQIDPSLYDHSACVAMFATIMAKQYIRRELPLRDVEVLAQCGLYHDMGKSCIPHAILNKPGSFTSEEYAVMKTHVQFGYEELMHAIAAGAPIDELVALVAVEHHERFTGQGYPRGKRGRLEDDPTHGIHVYSRIVAIADAYSALLMQRVYKPALPAEKALELLRISAHEDFDMQIFEPFVTGVEQSLTRLDARRLKLDQSKIFYSDSKVPVKDQIRSQQSKSGPGSSKRSGRDV